MRHAFRLAWRYLRYHRFGSAVLVACIVLTLYLPAAVHVILRQFNAEILARAAQTPAVIGAPGSRIDLVLDALYFQSDVERGVTYGEVAAVGTRGLAIPLHLEHTARGLPIVGTTLDYFRFRRLAVAEGAWMTRLGQCVVGAKVARRLGLAPGDRLKSDRENDLDIAGNPPLIMHVQGVLAPRGTPDDLAVFVDIKTAWIVAGLGHGHDDVDAETDPQLILGREGSKTIASAAVASYLEITEANDRSFHFHGNPDDFPVTAILVVPHDPRSRDLLAGQYQGHAAAQFVIPLQEVNQLMSLVFRIKALFDANAVVIGIGTFLLLVMVILLSLKLRQRELETMFKLGCSRGTIAGLLTAELALIAALGASLAAALVATTWAFADSILRALLAR